jgi:hypothetical protein
VQFGDQVLELALEVGLHLEELEPEHLGVGDEWIGPAVSDPDRLVDEVVGFHRLLSNGVDSVLEDLALSACHEWGMLVPWSVNSSLMRTAPVP